MKRRNFLASLFALPFAAKSLEALARSDERVGVFGRLFDYHKRSIDANTEHLNRLTEALANKKRQSYRSPRRKDA